MSVTDRAFVLHSLPYKETSLIVELLTREHGRLPVIAKGAKRPHSALRPVLVGFQPLHVRFSGKSEVKTLMQAEWAGSLMPPDGAPLFAAYYFNELLLNGLLREDPHPELFDAYESMLFALSNGTPLSIVVRRFEFAVLADLGYGLDFQTDGQGGQILHHLLYDFIPEIGWIPTSRGGPDNGVGSSSNSLDAFDLKQRIVIGLPGKLVLRLGEGEMSDELARAVKPLTRQLLARFLTPRGVSSRIWMEQLIRHD